MLKCLQKRILNDCALSDEKCGAKIFGWLVVALSLSLIDAPYVDLI